MIKVLIRGVWYNDIEDTPELRWGDASVNFYPDDLQNKIEAMNAFVLSNRSLITQHSLPTPNVSTIFHS